MNNQKLEWKKGQSGTIITKIINEDQAQTKNQRPALTNLYQLETSLVIDRSLPAQLSVICYADHLATENASLSCQWSFRKSDVLNTITKPWNPTLPNRCLWKLLPLTYYTIELFKHIAYTKVFFLKETWPTNIQIIFLYNKKKISQENTYFNVLASHLRCFIITTKGVRKTWKIYSIL